MRPLTRRGITFLLFATIVASALVSLLVVKLAAPKNHSHRPHSTEDFHDWVHANLKLSNEQKEAMASSETTFEEKKHSLEQRILQAGGILAHSMEEGHESDAEPFQNALRDLNLAQGELQQLTMRHFLEMQRHLSPSQSEQMLGWVHDSIVHQHSHGHEH